MGFNIAEAIFGVLLVYTLLPRFALNGYIGIIFFEEVFNFALSIYRLSRVTRLELIPTFRHKKCRE